MKRFFSSHSKRCRAFCAAKKAPTIKVLEASFARSDHTKPFLSGLLVVMVGATDKQTEPAGANNCCVKVMAAFVSLLVDVGFRGVWWVGGDGAELDVSTLTDAEQ